MIRRSVSFRTFALVLVLVRLLLGDLMQLPAAQAAALHAVKPVMMMAGEPCPGMAGTPSTRAEHPRPVTDGTCCKSSDCPCIHAAALTVTQQMPVQTGLFYADVPAPEAHRLNGPPPVFFRPPIQILP